MKRLSIVNFFEIMSTNPTSIISNWESGKATLYLYFNIKKHTFYVGKCGPNNPDRIYHKYSDDLLNYVKSNCYNMNCISFTGAHWCVKALEAVLIRIGAQELRLSSWGTYEYVDNCLINKKLEDKSGKLQALLNWNGNYTPSFTRR